MRKTFAALIYCERSFFDSLLQGELVTKPIEFARLPLPVVHDVMADYCREVHGKPKPANLLLDARSADEDRPHRKLHSSKRNPAPYSSCATRRYGSFSSAKT